MGLSSTRAKDRYNKNTYDRVYIRVLKGDKVRWLKAANKRGLSINSLVTDAVNTYIRGDNKMYNLKVKILAKGNDNDNNIVWFALQDTVKRATGDTCEMVAFAKDPAKFFMFDKGDVVVATFSSDKEISKMAKDGDYVIL